MWMNAVFAQTQPEVPTVVKQTIVQPATQPVVQQGAQPGQPNMLRTLVIPMAIVFGIFYFMVIRPQKRKDNDRKKLIDNVKSGDRLIFSGGMIGTVANVKDNVLVVKIAENVKVEIVRGAVLKVLEKGAEPTAADSN